MHVMCQWVNTLSHNMYYGMMGNLNVLLFCHFRNFENLENDMLMIGRHIESLNDKVKSNSDQQQLEPLNDTDKYRIRTNFRGT